MHASGTFDVKITPDAADEVPGTAALARLLLDKQFHGDLKATSKGTMLSAMTAVKGSAGYVAIERVTGELQGRRGTFVLQHNGTMNRSVPQLSVGVVPDSGTDQLQGLSGQMSIQITAGKHLYQFDYELNTAA